MGIIGLLLACGGMADNFSRRSTKEESRGISFQPVGETLNWLILIRPTPASLQVKKTAYSAIVLGSALPSQG